MTNRNIVYKVLGENGKPHHGGVGRWSLPKNGAPGKWKQVKGEIIPCENGLHLCREQDLIYWLGPSIWIAEYEGEPVISSDKIVVRKARLLAPTNWNRRMQRLFAADCAERSLRRLRKSGIEPDPRSVEAVRVARRYAVGKATADELDAARAAARAAAVDAAWTAAVDAERTAAVAAAVAAAWTAAVDAERAAELAAAVAAAGTAAVAAAWAAAVAAAPAAERAWQTKRLFRYLAIDESAL